MTNKYINIKEKQKSPTTIQTYTNNE